MSACSESDDVRINVPLCLWLSCDLKGAFTPNPDGSHQVQHIHYIQNVSSWKCSCYS